MGKEVGSKKQMRNNKMMPWGFFTPLTHDTSVHSLFQNCTASDNKPSHMKLSKVLNWSPVALERSSYGGSYGP